MASDDGVQAGPLQRLGVLATLAVLTVLLVVLGRDGWCVYGLIPVGYVAIIPIVLIALGVTGTDIYTPFLRDPGPGGVQTTQRWVIFWAGLLLSTISWVPFLFVGASVGPPIRLLATGERAAARVTAKSGQAGTASQRIAYSFMVGAKSYQGDLDVSRQAWEAASVGGTIDVVFDKVSPTRNCPVSNAYGMVIFAAIMSGLFLVGAAMTLGCNAGLTVRDRPARAELPSHDKRA